MPKIKVEGFLRQGPYSSPHTLTNYSVSFALCSSPKTGRKQCMNFATCKAFLHDSVLDYLTDSTGNRYIYYRKDTDPPIDMDKLRLLVGRGGGGKEFKEKLYAAKRVLNFYEETAGWKPSKIAQVEHSLYPLDVFLITGPKQWMSAPQLLSMAALVLRACTRNGPVRFENNDDLERVYARWINSASHRVSDTHYMKSCQKKLFLVMKHYDELFEGFKPEDLYVNNCVNVSSHSNGIQYLCDFMCATTKLNERFKKICEENGVK